MVGSTSSRVTWTPESQAGSSPSRHGSRRRTTSAGLKTTSARLRLERRLELGAQREDRVLVAWTTDQLNPDREPALRGGQRKTDRGLTRAVEGMGKAQPVEKLVRGGGGGFAPPAPGGRRVGGRRG